MYSGKRIAAFLAFFITLLFSSAALCSPVTTQKQAEHIAVSTPEIVSLLKQYGTCKGCSASYSEGKTNLIGCIEYKTTATSEAWLSEYWVSKVCGFRYSYEELTRVHVTIHKKDGHVSVTPSLAVIQSRTYCEKDNECMALSGSGVPFMGCGNAFHAYSAWAGSYDGKGLCICSNKTCTDGKSPVIEPPAVSQKPVKAPPKKHAKAPKKPASPRPAPTSNDLLDMLNNGSKSSE